VLATHMNERENNLRQQGYTPVEEALPPIGRCVVVLTLKAESLGFLDPSLNWRYKSDHGLIVGVMAWATVDAVLDRY
jgi:hypothetical protein